MVDLHVTDVHKNIAHYILVDVREPDELYGPEGYIEGIILAPLGEKLSAFLSSADPQHEYVFICRGGYRSGHACEIAQSYGFQKVYNMKGGMVAWNACLRKS